MQDQSEKWLRVLGLAPGASQEAIRDAYRDLVKVWHPDRFATDARLRQKAEEKLRDVNEAFGHLQSRPTQARQSGSSDGPPGRDTASSTAPRPGSPVTPLPSMYARLATALIVSAVIVGVSLFLSRRRAVDEPSGVSGLESPTPQADHHVSATPENRQPPPPDRPSVALRRVGPLPESPAAAATGSVWVESQPTGARIYFDGQAIGETPLVVTDVTPGEHQIGLDLAARGYQLWSSSVVVVAGREEKLLAVITPSRALR